MQISKGKPLAKTLVETSQVTLFESLQMDELDNRGKLVKLHQLTLEKRRRVATGSLYYFAKYILGFRDMQLQPHWELCKFLEKWGHRSDCLILLPRGTFKSSVITVAYPLWRWIQNKDLRVLVASAELSNAKGFLGLIRQNIELNKEFRDLFGNWDENDGQTWHSSALSLGGRAKLKAENSLTASSVDVTKVSQHYDYAILDDLQTEKNVTSKELIDRIEEYLQLMLPILDPLPDSSDSHGPRIIVGTRWHFDDVYGRLIAKEKKRRREGKAPVLRMLVRKAFEKKGDTTKVYFPTRFTKKYLDDLKESSNMSNYHFSCQYLNDPLPDEDVIFASKYLNYFQVFADGTGKVKEWTNAGIQGSPQLLTRRVRGLPTKLNFFTTIDPSVGKHTDSDYFAFVTIAVDQFYNMYIWDVRRKHFAGDTSLVIQEMFDIQHTYHPIKMGMESVAFQQYLLWSFRDACRERNEYFPIEELKTDNQMSKEMRIRGFQPYWKGRRVFLRVDPGVDMDKTPIDELRFNLIEAGDALLDEAERFPLGATKDCIDALAYAPQLIFPTEGERAAGPQPGTYAWLEAQLDAGSENSLRAY